MKHSIARRLAYKGRRTFTDWVMHQETRAEVARASKGLLQNAEVRPLDRREVSRIRDYAREVFGSAGYAAWLEFYTLFRGEFHEGWVPANFFQTIAIRKINGPQFGVDASRSLVTRILATPLFPDLAHFVSGAWYDIAGVPVERDRVPQLIFAGGDEACVKAEHTFKGRGISFVRRDGFDLAAIERAGNLVVQSVIRQHPAFDALSPSAVATLRVMTGKLPGNAPFLVGTYLRCSLGKGRAVGESSLRIAVADADGTLAGFATDPTYRRHATHPETGAAFAGQRIPSFRDLVATCLELHERLPQLAVIGWDVILDAAGAVRLMEVNTGHPDVKFIEMSSGPSLRAFRVENYARQT